ncbi:hypothetical protein ABXT08_02705 [Chryseobacterium sp. NRRL B-14859]|uniref:hypothetical protein n=1 Tax=Chryseobacterium sp. NRRL B-14859 TaxID=1562763 RepID=UPI00339903CB
MKNKNYLLLMVFFANIVFSQVGIGTANPRGALDINKETTNNMGLVLPTNANPSNLINPMGGNVAIGTIMYDSTLSCVRVFKSTGWSNCLCDQCGPTPGFTLDCSSGALSGTFTAGAAGSGSKVIKYTNATGQSYGAISIASTGVTGLTATAPAGTLASGNGSITLAISGTPSSAGTANFVITINGQSCNFSIAVNAGLRTIKILSLIPDDWISELASSGTRTVAARQKLDNPANFGPNGMVKVTKFEYNTFNVATGSVNDLNNAIDNADIVWTGYISNGNINAQKKAAIEAKIAEKKKFFIIAIDGPGGFFPYTSFGGYNFVNDGLYINTNSTNGLVTASSNGPDKGVFGDLADGAPVRINRYVGTFSNTGGATSFLSVNGKPAGTIRDNLIVYADVNMFLNNTDAYDGFSGRVNNNCTDNNNSVLFCNFFQKAVDYVLSHP